VLVIFGSTGQDLAILDLNKGGKVLKFLFSSTEEHFLVRSQVFIHVGWGAWEENGRDLGKDPTPLTFGFLSFHP